MSSYISSNVSHILDQIPQQSSAFVFGSGTIVASIVLIALSHFWISGSTKHVLRHTPFFGHLAFFTARHDFMDTTLKIAQQKLRKQNKDPQRGGIYDFHTVGHTVNVLHGETGRKLFFGDKNLSLYQGYLFLRGGFPTTSKLGEKIELDNSKLKERLLYFIRREYLTDVLPTIVSEITGELSKWGKTGEMDPYQRVYEFVFKLTCRLLVCTEFADNDKLRDHVRGLYWTIEDSANSFTNLVPWLRTRQKRAAAKATEELADIITNVINERKKTGRRENDPMQYQIDLGDRDADIIQYTFKILFAGSVNTAAIAAWALVYLSTHADQNKAVMEELQKAAHNTGMTGSLVEQLTHVPLDTWESEMPVLELVIKETIRLVFAIIALRRNINDPVMADGVKIAQGDFLAYFIHDIHLNPEIYPDPETWNPNRWVDNDSEKKTTYPFLGWGVARFPCTGMRMAKLEIKTIIALCIASYNFSSMDKSGELLRSDPEPDRNDWQRFMPLKPVRMGYERRA